MGNNNKNTHANRSLDQHVSDLAPRARVYEFERMASSNGLETGGVDLLNFIIFEDGGSPEDATQNIFLEMIGGFVVDNATVERVSALVDIGDRSQKLESFVRIRSVEEAVALALELKDPTDLSANAVKRFANTLRFYEDLFGRISWEAVPDYIKESTSPMLDDMRDELEQGYVWRGADAQKAESATFDDMTKEEALVRIEDSFASILAIIDAVPDHDAQVDLSVDLTKGAKNNLLGLTDTADDPSDQSFWYRARVDHEPEYAS